MISFKEFDASLAENEEWLRKEFSALRTGRASTALLDSVRVDAYGSKMPIAQVATVGTEDPRTIRVAPWDITLADAIEKAIRDADLGVSLSRDGKGLRVSFPELTQETRKSLLRVANEKREQARVAIRGHREALWSKIQEGEKNGSVSEDEKFRLKDEMQKKVEEANKQLDELYEKKQKEIES